MLQHRDTGNVAAQRRRDEHKQGDVNLVPTMCRHLKKNRNSETWRKEDEARGALDLQIAFLRLHLQRSEGDVRWKVSES